MSGILLLILDVKRGRETERERETERDKINETASEFSKTLLVGQRRNQRDAPPPPVADK